MSFIPYPDWIKPEIIPGLPLHWYGLMYLVAFGIVYLLFSWQVKQRKLAITSDLSSGFFFWVIIGLLIGGRLFSVFIYDTSGIYQAKPWLAFWPFDEAGTFTGLRGMSYHGGVVGAVLAAVIYLRIKKQNFLLWADMVCVAVPLGYTFGRLGNFINGELYGRVTTGWWGMLFPQAERLPLSDPGVAEAAHSLGMAIVPGQTMINLPRHASQLYEAGLEGLGLWLLLWFVARRFQPFRGFVLGCYITGYGLIRFFLEYVRQPDPGIDFPIIFDPSHLSPYLTGSLVNFTMGQILCVLMVLGGGIFLAIRASQTKKRGSDSN